MSKAIIFYSIFYSLISVGFYTYEDKNELQENKIEWCSKNKLSWNDFKGVADSTRTYLMVASTQGIIKNENGKIINGVPKFDVKCYFIRDKSWTVVNDKETLAHEQLHFDIYEIYARKIRKAYDSLNIMNINNIKIYQKVYDDLMVENNNYNDIYDNQVYFNEEKQKQWSLKIAKELEELKAYEVKCSCKK